MVTQFVSCHQAHSSKTQQARGAFCVGTDNRHYVIIWGADGKDEAFTGPVLRDAPLLSDLMVFVVRVHHNVFLFHTRGAEDHKNNYRFSTQTI
jgi:hypothetical protein